MKPGGWASQPPAAVVRSDPPASFTTLLSRLNPLSGG
jgi:hypothetical protein